MNPCQPNATETRTWLTLLLTLTSLSLPAVSLAQRVDDSGREPSLPAAPSGEMPQDEGPLKLSPPEVSRQRDGHPRYGLVIAGSVVFALDYLPGLVLAVMAQNSTCAGFCSSSSGLSSQNGWAAVPVVGPLVYAGVAFGAPDQFMGPIMLIHAGVQAAALVMLTVGLLSHVDGAPKEPRISIAPARIGSGNGIALAGHF